MNEHNFCMGCQYYNKPYWSIVSPCASCPRIYGTDSFITTVTTQAYTNANNCFKKTEYMEDFAERFWEVFKKEYDYRDMLDLDEIQKIFDKIKE